MMRKIRSYSRRLLDLMHVCFQFVFVLTILLFASIICG